MYFFSPSDLEETKRLIVENSHLPMSVILVGVGSVKAADAAKLELLDDDARTLRDARSEFLFQNPRF